MHSSGEIIGLLRKHKRVMHERFSVGRIGLFGSYMRNQPTPHSDIDILVDLEDPTFDHYMDLKFYLEDLFQRPVDVVLADGVKPRARPYIEREVQYV